MDHRKHLGLVAGMNAAARRHAVPLLVVVLVAMGVSRDVAAADPCTNLPGGGDITVPVPGVVTNPACNTDCSGRLPPGVPMPANPVFGYAGSDQSQCELKKGGQSRGPANATRFVLPACRGRTATGSGSARRRTAVGPSVVLSSLLPRAHQPSP
jgi:hypothetical protein